METTITIKGIEVKKSQNGRLYHSVDTDQGRMSCFEDKICEFLKANIGKSVNVDISEVNNFKNIRKILADVKTEKPGLALLPPISQDNFAQAREEKNRTMYVSYAKDIFCDLSNRPSDPSKLSVQQIMEVSIALVKQAIKEF